MRHLTFEPSIIAERGSLPTHPIYRTCTHEHFSETLHTIASGHCGNIETPGKSDKERQTQWLSLQQNKYVVKIISKDANPAFALEAGHPFTTANGSSIS